MRKPLYVLLILAVVHGATAVAAPPRVEAGPALGVMSYRSPEAHTVPIGGLEVLLSRNAFALHVTEEYADLTGLGTLTATHAGVLYSHPLGEMWVRTGGGVSFVSVTNLESATTWNAEAEISRRWGRADVFARLRYCRFTLNGFREQARVRGPVAFVGVRFVVWE